MDDAVDEVWEERLQGARSAYMDSCKRLNTALEELERHRAQLRDLVLARRRLRIQRNAVVLARRRVESSLLNQEAGRASTGETGGCASCGGTVACAPPSLVVLSDVVETPDEGRDERGAHVRARDRLRARRPSLLDGPRRCGQAHRAALTIGDVGRLWRRHPSGSKAR